MELMEAAIAGCGLNVVGCDVVELSPPYDQSGASTAVALKILREMLLKLEEPPTAVLTTNYNITMGLVTAVRERGICIPDEIDIFGFDCVEVCTMMHPALPVVQQPEQEIGQTAAEYLLQRLKGFDGKPRVTRLHCRIITDPDYSIV